MPPLTQARMIDRASVAKNGSEIRVRAKVICPVCEQRRLQDADDSFILVMVMTGAIGLPNRTGKSSAAPMLGSDAATDYIVETSVNRAYSSR